MKVIYTNKERKKIKASLIYKQNVKRARVIMFMNGSSNSGYGEPSFHTDINIRRRSRVIMFTSSNNGEPSLHMGSNMGNNKLTDGAKGSLLNNNPYDNSVNSITNQESFSGTLKSNQLGENDIVKSLKDLLGPNYSEVISVVDTKQCLPSDNVELMQETTYNTLYKVICQKNLTKGSNLSQLGSFEVKEISQAIKFKNSTSVNKEFKVVTTSITSDSCRDYLIQDPKNVGNTTWQKSDGIMISEPPSVTLERIKDVLMRDYSPDALILDIKKLQVISDLQRSNPSYSIVYDNNVAVKGGCIPIKAYSTNDQNYNYIKGSLEALNKSSTNFTLYVDTTKYIQAALLCYLIGQKGCPWYVKDSMNKHWLSLFDLSGCYPYKSIDIICDDPKKFQDIYDTITATDLLDKNKLQFLVDYVREIMPVRVACKNIDQFMCSLQYNLEYFEKNKVTKIKMPIISLPPSLGFFKLGIEQPWGIIGNKLGLVKLFEVNYAFTMMYTCFESSKVMDIVGRSVTIQDTVNKDNFRLKVLNNTASLSGLVTVDNEWMKYTGANNFNLFTRYCTESISKHIELLYDKMTDKNQPGVVIITKYPMIAGYKGVLDNEFSNYNSLFKNAQLGVIKTTNSGVVANRSHVDFLIDIMGKNTRLHSLDGTNRLFRISDKNGLTNCNNRDILLKLGYCDSDTTIKLVLKDSELQGWQSEYIGYTANYDDYKKVEKSIIDNNIVTVPQSVGYRGGSNYFEVTLAQLGWLDFQIFKIIKKIENDFPEVYACFTRIYSKAVNVSGIPLRRITLYFSGLSLIDQSNVKSLLTIPGFDIVLIQDKVPRPGPGGGGPGGGNPGNGSDDDDPN